MTDEDTSEKERENENRRNKNVFKCMCRVTRMDRINVIRGSLDVMDVARKIFKKKID